MIDRNLENDRASYAYACAKSIKNIGGETEKKYHSAVRSSGALIQNSGLLHTLSFYLSKKSKDNNPTHYELLADHILQWKYVYGGDGNRVDLYYNLLILSDEKIMNRTHEAKALILWLKRSADAMLRSEDIDAQDA